MSGYNLIGEAKGAYGSNQDLEEDLPRIRDSISDIPDSSKEQGDFVLIGFGTKIFHLVGMADMYGICSQSSSCVVYYQQNEFETNVKVSLFG